MLIWTFDHLAGSSTSVPELITPRLLLRAPSAQDFDASAAMWADENVVRYISGKPSTSSESWARLLRYIGHWQELGYGEWIVEDRETGQFFGEVGFADHKRNMEPGLGDLPEAGWVLTTNAHGKGIATEALKAALAWADSNLASAGTACIFDPDHRASQNVARKCGYTERGMAIWETLPALVMERTRPPSSTAT